MLRRDLLKMGSAAAIGVLAPGLARAADPAADKTPGTLAWDRSLVLIELGGGNDGLNTVVPYADPEYYKLRKRIGVPEADVFKLDKGLGLNGTMKALEASWKEGDLSFFLGLGYPNLNRSHFRGIDIWNGASKHDEMPPDGWLARILDGANNGAPSDLLAHSITLGGNGAYGGGGALYGHQLNRLTMERPEDFVRRAKRIPKPGDKIPNSAMSHIMHIQSDINRTADRLEEAYRKAPKLPDFPRTGLGEHLQIAAKLITAGVTCPVYKTGIYGFDHHSNENAAHPGMVGEIANALAAFRLALKSVPGRVGAHHGDDLQRVRPARGRERQRRHRPRHRRAAPGHGRPGHRRLLRQAAQPDPARQRRPGLHHRLPQHVRDHRPAVLGLQEAVPER